MNLYFRVNGTREVVDFPFQTPTDLTYAVIGAPTLERRLEIVREFIYSRDWWDAEEREVLWAKCRECMNSTSLTLAMR